MNFRRHRHHARRLSRMLLCAYALAVCAVAGLAALTAAWLSARQLLPDGAGAWAWHLNRPVFATVFLLTVGGTVAASIWRMRRLAAGGQVVAEALGGRRLKREESGLAERRLLNVVEEVALAAGARMPQVYLLEQERCINAFAAGHDPRHAVIGITRGALVSLQRHELQAVVAHEFSHILNGDMRRNMQLCGWLFGLQALSTAGHLLCNGRRPDDLAQEKWEQTVYPTVFLGLPLLAVGMAGSLAASWIQAALCRQREYLADATAVTLCRQSEGLAAALYRSAVAPYRSMHSPHAAEYAHLMFEDIGRPRLFKRLSSSHPDVYRRIERLAPHLAKGWHDDIRTAEADREAVLIYGRDRFSDGLLCAFAAAENEWAGQWRQRQLYGLRVAQQMNERDPALSDRLDGLTRHVHRHWLNAADDGERLLAAAAALLLSDGLNPQTAEQWQKDAPFRFAYYQRLRRHPPPAACMHTLADYLLPGAAALPEDERQQLIDGITALLLCGHRATPRALRLAAYCRRIIRRRPS